MEEKKNLIIILGPTASGKSSLALFIASHYNIPIISADSRQIYKDMHIGTAAPDALDLAKCKHYFVNQMPLDEEYNAFRYEHDVLELLEILYQSSSVSLMCGGSMMYIDAVCKGIDLIPDPDPEVRKSLMKVLENQGIEPLQEQLKKLDNAYYQTVDLQNPARLIHALEISITTNKPYSSFLTKSVKTRNFNIIKIGLNLPRQQLYDRINSRVETMISMGLIEEARSLLTYQHLKSLNSVGYRELFDYFNGKCELNDAIEKIKRNSRHYAKKQITWFSRDKSIAWFDPSDSSNILSYLDRSLK